MNPEQPMGLVAAGSGVRTLVARVPSLLGRLGPVKCISFSTARKLVRTLGAGYAISAYGALDGCALIWVLVPESHLDRVITDLASQPWLGQTPVILCQTVRESSSAQLLRARGGKVASLNAVGEGRHAVLVAEGHRDPLRVLRKMCAQQDRRLIQMPGGAKPHFLAGMHLATDLLRPWLAASVECFRTAGFERTDAVELTGTLGGRAVRAHLSAGQAPMSAPAKAELRRALGDIEAMTQASRKRAELYLAAIQHALAYLGDTKSKGTHA